VKRRGRPSLGVDLVDSLEGPEEDLRRLKVVLRTITGETTVKAASRELAVSEARFHEVRRQILRSALEGTKPGLPGRPRADAPAGTEEVRELRARVKWLEEELQCAYVRTEIALVMPGLLKRAETRREKKGACSRRRKRGRPSSGGSAGT